MKYTVEILILGLLLLFSNSIAMAIEIRGAVVETAGLDVTVKVSGGSLPSSGDLMEISFVIPDGESLPVGTWKVTSVSSRFISASVVENTGTPAKGQQAVIFSENPVPITSVRKKPDSRSNNDEQRAYSAPTGTAHMTPEAQEVVKLLRSAESANKRNGAKRAHRHFANDAGVIAIVAEELNKGYTEKPRDGHHVDAMAWLCNALGASKDTKYKELLTLVARKSPSKKIRKYAKKNLRYMR